MTTCFIKMLIVSFFLLNSIVVSVSNDRYRDLAMKLVFKRFDHHERPSLRLWRGMWVLITYCNQWKIECLNKPKLHTYVKFKTCFKIEDYVMSFMSRRQRSYLAPLRCSILPLHIETGRWYRVKENRLCKACNNNQIENEYHFIFHCNAYSRLRTAFITKFLV